MMNSKPWKDAACLIMFARNSFLRSGSQGLFLSPNEAKSNYDYKVLMLKRSGKSKFMPNAYVFPGGVVSNSDFNRDWLTIIDKFGNEPYHPLISNDSRPRPFMMQKKDRTEEKLIQDLAFRICAIRETFEESGLFLHLPDQHGNKIPTHELAVYRPQVYMEAGNFMKMCLDFQVCPDIWNLNEYRTWLTPTSDAVTGSPKRFDTMFYTAFLHDVDAASLDDHEIIDACWTDPQDILEQCQQEKLWLAPPQVYELSQIKKAKTFDELQKICKDKHELGFTSWMPVFRKCQDAMISILPGDELYPETPDYEGNSGKLPPLEGTVEHVNKQYPRCNRLAIFSKNNVQVFVS